MKEKSGKNLWKPKKPGLRLRYKILLYFSMVLFVILSLISVVCNCFPYPIEMACYVLAACTLFSGCYYLISDVQYGIKEIIKPKIAGNPYANRIAADYRLRTFVFAVPGVASNVIFAVYNGVTAILSHSAWFGTLAAYYILLSVMRIGAVNQERRISRIGQRGERTGRKNLSRTDDICCCVICIL